jgi:hypothetical protein
MIQKPFSIRKEIYVYFFLSFFEERAYLSTRQHTLQGAQSALGRCIRQHTSAYVSIRQHTLQGAQSAPGRCIRQDTSAYVSIRQHTSAYVSIRYKVLMIFDGPVY